GQCEVPHQRRPAPDARHTRQGHRRARRRRLRRRRAPRDPARRHHAGAHGLRMGIEAAGEGKQAMRNPDMLEALSALAAEKGISEDVMLEALANALVTAYKRMPDAAEEALVEIDVETGDIRVIAQELDEDGNVTREWDDTPADFGRIAAQTAKQV